MAFAGRHPHELDTQALAPLLKHIVGAGAERVYIGLGGSATNDGGFGLGRALGVRFLDACGSELLSWTELERLDSMELGWDARASGGAPPFAGAELFAAVDVNNPLLGEFGATFTYGPQKGLLSSQLVQAERCLARLAEVTERQLGREIARLEGAGAAGGLGFGLAAFAGAKLCSGSELFERCSQLTQRIAQADVVITAEGSLDAQSLMGKGVGLVARRAAEQRKRCVCFAGQVRLPEEAPWAGFESFGLVPHFTDLDTALRRPAECLVQLAERVARGWRAGA